MPTPKFTTEILAAAIAGFEQQKHQIESQIAELRTMMTGGQTEAAAPAPVKTGKRKVSAATRKLISDAQRKRWLEAKKPAETSSQKLPADAKKPKRRLSAAGRRNIVEATKRRWALKRAAEAKSPVVVAKKTAPPTTAKAAVKTPVVKKAAPKA